MALIKVGDHAINPDNINYIEPRQIADISWDIVNTYLKQGN